MKLDKTTRELVQIGTILESRGDKVEVTNIIPIYSKYRGIQGKKISIKWLNAADKRVIGRVSPQINLSEMYGWEIVK